MHEPLISVVSPTYNSEKTLIKTLMSIRKQSYPKERVEILLVDGGSTDKTIDIANKFGCRIIPNPKTDIIYAQHLGYKAARGKYLLYLAPDEVLENVNSLEIKSLAFRTHPEVKAVLPTGYKTPKNYSAINHYINEFGDPFSFFMYRDSKGYRYLKGDLERNYRKVMENKNCAVFAFPMHGRLPLIELWAGGCMLDLEYSKKTFPQINSKPELIPLLFYLLNQKRKLIAVTKNDPTIHYSTSTIRKYLKKIRSRVEFNTFLAPMGRGGFSGREHFEHTFTRYKKFLFIPYSFSLILPWIDSLYLYFTRKQPIFLLHVPLCLYTSALIIYYRAVKLLGIKHSMRLYGH